MKIALITGASSGIGREFAKQISCRCRELDEIWLVARRAERLEEFRYISKIPVRNFCLDLFKEEAFFCLQEKLDMQKVDIRILVNAAGMGKSGTIEKMDWKVQKETILLNCIALSGITKLCLPYLQKGSKVFQIASASAFGPQPDFAVYAATKAYVLSYSRAFAEEVKEKGIIVTCVCPGPVDTEFFGQDGKPKSKLKQRSMASAEDVVKKALRDSEKRNSLSVYKGSMKTVHGLWKVVPTTWMLKLMKKFL